MSKKDDEKTDNKTGKALKYLMVAVCVVFSVLLANMVFNIYVKWDHEEAEWEDYFGDQTNDDHRNSDSDVFYKAPLFVGLAFGITIALIMLVGMSVLISVKKAYGSRHSKKVLVALFCLLLSIFWFLLTPYVYFKADELYGLFPGIGVICFTTAIFLTTYELGGKRYGTIGLMTGISSAIPLMFMHLPRYEGTSEIASELIPFNQRMMLAQFGLLVAMGFFMASIKSAKVFVKEFPATLYDPKPSFNERKHRPTIRWKRPPGKKKKTLTIAIVVIVILSAIGIYWFAIRVPGIEDFMKGSYSDGEKARFKAKVSDVEIIETSYGTATLVSFEDFLLPFCLWEIVVINIERGKPLLQRSSSIYTMLTE